MRNPRDMAARSIVRPVMSPSARNMPADLISTTIMTMHMVTMETISNFGKPNWKG